METFKLYFPATGLSRFVGNAAVGISKYAVITLPSDRVKSLRWKRWRRTASDINFYFCFPAIGLSRFVGNVSVVRKYGGKRDLPSDRVKSLRWKRVFPDFFLEPNSLPSDRVKSLRWKLPAERLNRVKSTISSQRQG